MLTCKHATPSSVRARGTYRCKIAVISRNLPSARQLPSATRGPEEPSSTSQTPGRQPLPLPSEPSSEQRPGSAGNQETLATQAAKWAAEVVASPLFYLVAGLAAIKLLSLTGLEDGVTIFLFAALPITALTALSKSSLGKQVQQQLESKLPELQARAEALRRAHQQARRRSPWYGERRPRLPGPLGAATHLDGSEAGDAGFDPLGLGKDPATFARYREAELLHARWAMLAVIGCLVPELISLLAPEEVAARLGEPVWWRVGAAKLREGLTINWGGIEGFRLAGKQGVGLIAACQAVLMGGPEYARYVGIRSLEPVGVFLPGDQNYPGGGPFDPLNMAEDAEGFVDQAVREVKNGRLAMVAMLGMFVQAAVTRQGPVQNLLDFVADPIHNNAFTRLTELLSACSAAEP